MREWYVRYIYGTYTLWGKSTIAIGFEQWQMWNSQLWNEAIWTLEQFWNRKVSTVILSMDTSKAIRLTAGWASNTSIYDKAVIVRTLLLEWSSFLGYKIKMFKTYIAHYSDVIMNRMASQITSVSIVCNCLFRCRSKKTSKLCITGLCVGNPPVTGIFPSHRTRNAENVSIWRCHHVITLTTYLLNHTMHSRMMHMVHALLCFAVLEYHLILPTIVRVVLLALGQSYDCPSARKQPWRLWIKFFTYIYLECMLHPQQKKAQQNSVYILWNIVSVMLNTCCIMSYKLYIRVYDLDRE